MHSSLIRLWGFAFSGVDQVACARRYPPRYTSFPYCLSLSDLRNRLPMIVHLFTIYVCCDQQCNIPFSAIKVADLLFATTAPLAFGSCVCLCAVINISTFTTHTFANASLCEGLPTGCEIGMTALRWCTPLYISPSILFGIISCNFFNLRPLSYCGMST